MERVNSPKHYKTKYRKWKTETKLNYTAVSQIHISRGILPAQQRKEFVGQTSAVTVNAPNVVGFFVAFKGPTKYSSKLSNQTTALPLWCARRRVARRSVCVCGACNPCAIWLNLQFTVILLHHHLPAVCAQHCISTARRAEAFNSVEFICWLTRSVAHSRSALRLGICFVYL